MPASSTDVVNETLVLIGQQVRITSLSDGSTAAKCASAVYEPTVALMLRELDPDFARATLALTVAAVASPIIPWAYEYAYPTDCVRVRAIRPPASGVGADADPYDPSPVRSSVAYDPSAGTNAKVILTNMPNAIAVYTSSNAAEALWDAAFTEAVVRRLANPLAMGMAGRPDFANAILEQASRMAATCEAIDESSVRRPM